MAARIRIHASTKTRATGPPVVAECRVEAVARRRSD